MNRPLLNASTRVFFKRNKIHCGSAHDLEISTKYKYSMFHLFKYFSCSSKFYIFKVVLFVLERIEMEAYRNA